MDVCDEEFYVTTDSLRAYRPRSRIKATTSPVFEERHTALGLISSINSASIMEDDGDTDVGDLEEHDSSREDSTKLHDFRLTKQRKKPTVDVNSGLTGCNSSDSHDLKLSGRNLKSRKPKVVPSPTVPVNQPYRLASQQAQQPRNYRVVHTTADGSSQKSLKLTLRAASPKEETKLSTPVSGAVIPDPDLSRMVTPNNYQHFVSQHNNIISTPLNIDTGDESSSASSTSSSSQSSSFYDDLYHHKRPRRRGFSTNDRWSSASQKLTNYGVSGAVEEAKNLGLVNSIITTINNNISTTTTSTSTISTSTLNVVPSNIHIKDDNSLSNPSGITVSEVSGEVPHDGKSTRVTAQSKKVTRATPTLAQRKGRNTVSSSMKAPAPPRRANGKRTLTSGPMLNGYGVPASIESMSSLKDFINYDNFISLSLEMQRELMTLLPSTDCHRDEEGNIGINPSALKNEYFSKSLDEYLNKGYRAAAMKSQRYPLSTGHNTRQRRRNEDTGVDLSPKDEWKKAYFENYWGEKSSHDSSFEKSSVENSSPSANCTVVPKTDLRKSLQLKQPVVKLTRTRSLSESNDEPLLKVAAKGDDALEVETARPISPEIPVSMMLDSAMPLSHTPNSRTVLPQNVGPGTARTRNGKWQRLRKREQRTSDSTISGSLLTQHESTGNGARKRRRRQSVLASSPIHLPRETQLCSLSVAASALSLVDEQGKTNSTKSGSSSGPSNNSSSSPSTYGETSPQNEELGGHPSEFIKPRPPPPPSSGVAAVAAAAAAHVSLPSGMREKAYPGSGHHPLSSAAQNRLSRLNGKTVGEMRRDISYRMMTVNQRVNTTGNQSISASGTIPSASLSPLPPPTSGATVVSLAPAFIKGIPSASHHHPVLNMPWSRGRKYALAARTFERQLNQRKLEKAEENCGLTRSKKSHMIRLKRLQECNARRAGELRSSDSSIKTENIISPFSCPTSSSQADSSQPSSGDWTMSGNAKDTTCASSSTSASTLTSGSSVSTTRLPSAGVVRTRDGASIVFRDKLCPATLANVCKRLPGADVQLSFGIPEELLPRLHEELTDVCSSSQFLPGSRVQLRWKVDRKSRVVNLSFFEAPSEVESKIVTKVEPYEIPESTVQPSNLSSPCAGAPESPFPSPSGDRVVENSMSEAPDIPSQLLTCPMTSWNTPSHHSPSSPTAGISVAREPEVMLSPVVDDFLSESEEKCFRMKQHVLLD